MQGEDIEEIEDFETLKNLETLTFFTMPLEDQIYDTKHVKYAENHQIAPTLKTTSKVTLHSLQGLDPSSRNPAW